MEDLLKFNRRKFLGSSIKLAAAIGISGIPLDVFANRDLQLLTILHTNDTHSRIDPFPANDPKFAGMGGIVERLNIIEKINASSALSSASKTFFERMSQIRISALRGSLIMFSNCIPTTSALSCTSM